MGQGRPLSVRVSRDASGALQFQGQDFNGFGGSDEYECPLKPGTAVSMTPRSAPCR
jgi:hypothetical protein